MRPPSLRTTSATRSLAGALALTWLAGCSSDPAPIPPDTVPPPDAEPPVDTLADAAADTLLCSPHALYCLSPREAAVCDADGAGPASTTPCRGATACEPATGLCRPTICAPDVRQCLNLGAYQVCAPDGSGWGAATPCPEDRFCVDGTCRGCVAERVECLSPSTFRACAPDGSAWSEESPCPDGHRCVADACVACDIVARCASPFRLRRTCSDPSVAFAETVSCPAGQRCYDDGCYVCAPDSRTCIGESAMLHCQADGLAWEPSVACHDAEVCVEGACTPYVCTPRVLLLLDQSGSMGNHWTTVQASIAALAAANPSVRFGLKAFPSGAGTCGVDAALQVPFAPHNGDALGAWFEVGDYGGSTPLVAALHVVREHAAEWFGSLGGSVVVLSDGVDTCYAGDALDADLAATTADLVIDHAVTTYVIGYAFAGETAELDTIAHNGGTPFHTHVAAGDEAELTAAFEAIVGDLKHCDELP